MSEASGPLKRFLEAGIFCGFSRKSRAGPGATKPETFLKLRIRSESCRSPERQKKLAAMAAYSRLSARDAQNSREADLEISNLLPFWRRKENFSCPCKKHKWSHVDIAR